MVNKERIVPIQRIDLLTNYHVMLSLANISHTVISGDVEGNFTVTGSGDVGNKLANQPVEALNFASGVTAAVVYFVADFDYKGFSINGTAVVTTGADVEADGATLYKATLSGGGVAIAAV